jgi:predicted phosphodiesterase
MKLEYITRTEIDDYITARVECATDSPKIYTLNDWHLGSINCDRKAIKKYVKYIQSQDDAICVCLGDLLENSNKNSIGAGVYDQESYPDEQLEEVLELLEPIKDKIIGVVGGNHERRAKKDSGIRLDRLMARDLGVQWFDNEIMMVLYRKSGDHSKSASFYFNHTKISGKNKATIMNTMDRDVAGKSNFDVYVKGHDHQVGCLGFEYMHFDKRTCKVSVKIRYHVLTGSFLHRPNSYATERPYMPTAVGAVEILPDMRFSTPFTLNHAILTF